MNPCTPGPWTVTQTEGSFHEDSDPLGTFTIEEVQSEAEKWYDASFDAEPNSDEEQHALDRRDEIQESARRLISAAPDLLEALRYLLGDHQRMFSEAHPDSTIAWWDCEEVKAAKAAIKKATQP
jgi:hypothetical protein